MKTKIFLECPSIKTRFIGLYVYLFSSLVIAAAPVENINSGLNSKSQLIHKFKSKDINNDPHYQGQLLKEEVKALRGLVEEIRNDINQLTKQQRDNYLDLDYRLSNQTKNIRKKSGKNENKDSSILIAPKADKNEISLGSQKKEKENYDKAYATLKEGNINLAISNLKSHISKYPGGSFVPNAYYWLGEIYLLQSQLNLAHEVFLKVHLDYPSHRKYLDSTFKLGQVYYMQGEKVKAKKIMDSITVGGGNTAKLARKFVSENFSASK
ncbi:MAG: hypothetical protein CMK44_07260 [Porticoccus sp.]|jgi:tol-pal system protein YbgF|nr:hypothetical protein [Porticoccus sp.]